MDALFNSAAESNNNTVDRLQWAMFWNSVGMTAKEWK